MPQHKDPTQWGDRFDGWLLSLIRARHGWMAEFEDESSVLFSRRLAQRVE